MGNNDNKKKRQGSFYSQSLLESFSDIGSNTANTIKKDLLSPIPEDIRNQILGLPTRNFSGEILPGENLEMKEVITGERQQVEKSNKQLVQINLLEKEQKKLSEQKLAELKLQLKAIHEEIISAVRVTNDLEQEVQIAALQSPSDPSQYEFFFLEHILNFIRSFKEKAENARVWLSLQNKRAAKRNVWAQNYKSMKGKYLLSKEHYLSRSAA